MKEEICQHLDCEKKSTALKYCDFHLEGGIFGTGESYEQYQIIEKDFMEFIKIVPISDKKHLSVHSPVLRDIILRTCVQVEIFFKEWAKLIFSNQEENLYKLYHKLDKQGKRKGARNWNFKDYYIFKEQYGIERPIYVKPMNEEIQPFKDWKNSKDSELEWWNTYNSIKHDGIKSKEQANLNIALKALSALFALHCTNKYSKNYITSHNIISISRKMGKMTMTSKQLSSPLGTHQFLFRDVINKYSTLILPKSEDNNRLTSKGRKV